MTSEREHLFVYGMLMDSDVLEDLAPKATFVGPAYARDHKLVFSLVAYLIPQEGRRTFGALLELDERHLVTLDYFEGASYDRKKVTVDTPWDEYEAWAYVAYDPVTVDRLQMPPAQNYLSWIRQGYARVNAPDPAYDILARSLSDSVEARNARSPLADLGEI